ncbi:MAG TPA: HEAT repeat domain-containing protein [Kineosporiaceae bacterium]|nr:HEAT repeat domain-containing protein [Kineosporiaceae bacterium]
MIEAIGDEREIRTILARVDALFSSGLADRRRRSTSAARRVVADLQVGALHHPDPHIRRSCLWWLDHHANDASMAVFALALRDEVDFVRDVALHSLACEGCKTDQICLTDVVPSLVRVLEEDPKPDLRVKALSALLALSDRDPRARAALDRAGRDNTDPVVRRCAADAAKGGYVAPKKRYERRQRRRGALGHGTLSGDVSRH